MSLNLIFDDTLRVPPSLGALIGVDTFGSLVFQRRSRTDAMRRRAEEVGANFIHIRDAADRAALLDALPSRDTDDTFIFCPSHLICVDEPTHLGVFLRQIQFAPTPLYMPVEGTRERRGWMSMRAELLPRFLLSHQEESVSEFFAEHGDLFVEVRERLRIIDVSEERTLLHFLSGQFDARHFNTIVHDDFTVTKQSTDREKLRKEFDFYELVSPEMQMFLVKPFDFKDDGARASYRMERLSMPDMALQWVHGSFKQGEFDRFLSHIFHVFAVRPRRPAPPSQIQSVQHALYVDKVESRIRMLKELPAYSPLEPLLRRASDGVDVLVARYFAHYERLQRRSRVSDLVAGHGDPCFSNILYSKANQYLKLIDPRGARNADDLYTDPYYDIAKLSHSVLGHYDFINLNRFDLTVDEELHFRLSIDHPPPPWSAEIFLRHLANAHYDADLVRLYEAGLFISMMPLHIDRPRKVLGFAVNAARILDELSAATGVPK